MGKWTSKYETTYSDGSKRQSESIDVVKGVSSEIGGSINELGKSLKFAQEKWIEGVEQKLEQYDSIVASINFLSNFKGINKDFDKDVQRHFDNLTNKQNPVKSIDNFSFLKFLFIIIVISAIVGFFYSLPYMDESKYAAKFGVGFMYSIFAGVFLGWFIEIVQGSSSKKFVKLLSYDISHLHEISLGISKIIKEFGLVTNEETNAKMLQKIAEYINFAYDPRSYSYEYEIYLSNLPEGSKNKNSSSKNSSYEDAKNDYLENSDNEKIADQEKRNPVRIGIDFIFKMIGITLKKIIFLPKTILTTIWKHKKKTIFLILSFIVVFLYSAYYSVVLLNTISKEELYNYPLAVVSNTEERGFKETSFTLKELEDDFAGKIIFKNSNIGFSKGKSAKYELYPSNQKEVTSIKLLLSTRFDWKSFTTYVVIRGMNMDSDKVNKLLKTKGFSGKTYSEAEEDLEKKYLGDKYYDAFQYLPTWRG